MKLRTKIGVFAIALSSLSFVSNSSAQACSVEDPCHTYAVLDDSGLVTNIISCSTSVCGSGTFGGNKVVPQVAANASTGQNQGGHLTSPDGGEVRYSEPTGTFTVNNNVIQTKVDVVTNQTTTDTKTVTETSTVVVSIATGNQSSFTYDDTVGKSISDIPFTILSLPNNTSATISATDVTTEVTPTETTKLTATQSVTFEERKTEQFVEEYLVNNNYNRLLSKFARIARHLTNWFL
jgi:hypothetical protein